MKEFEIFKINLQLFADDDEEKEEDEKEKGIDDEGKKESKKEKNEEKPDLKKIKEELRQELLKEIKEKEESENNTKLINDIKKKLEKKAKDENETDKDIMMSQLNQQVIELSDALKMVTEKLEQETIEKQKEKVHNEIRKRADKEPFIKDLVMKYLDSNVIKSIEDYDAIITPDIKKLLKEAHDIKEKAKQMGADPMGDYQDSKKNNSKGVDWKKGAAEKYSDEIKKSLGIRKI